MDPHRAHRNDVDGARRADSSTSGDRTVESLIDREVVALPATTTLRDTARAMRTHSVGLVVVGDAEHVDGVVSERDLVDAVANGLHTGAATIGDIESHRLSWALATSSVSDVAREMLDTHVRHILICRSDGGLVGVVSIRDVLRALAG